VSSYVRIDGEGADLVAARMSYRPASAGGRGGFVFHVAGHGGRHVVHLAAWAPAETISDLSGQTITIREPGPDCAANGRLFASLVIRFGRVTGARAVVSLDGEVEDLDPRSAARATFEADIRCSVEATVEPAHCVACSAALAPHATELDEFVGGTRVRLRTTHVTCPEHEGFAQEPRHCPICGDAYDAAEVHSLSDDGVVGWTAACPNGHTYSGRLGEA
jgi:predicted nucleic acid-binding Zn ribbon protein